MGQGPLTGIRVVDLTQFESGTVCTETLAWLGAEVIKVERPVRGELGRFAGGDMEHDAYGFIVLNMNKEGVTCNMKTPEGHDLILKLLEKSDVIVENMSPGAMERLGLGYEDCKKVNPKIIYGSIKGFATGSPYQDYPAFDPIATHMGGFVAATGWPDKPVKSGVSVADSGTGYMLALSIIAALYQRDHQGVGQKIEVAMQDYMIGLGRSGWEPFYNTGKPPRRVGNGMPLEDVAPSDTFPCKPGGPNDYVHIYTSRHEGATDWDRFCKVIGHEELLDDPDMATPHERFLHRDKLYPLIEEWTSRYTKQEAMDILCKQGNIPAGAVLDVEDITNDDRFVETGTMVEQDYYGKKVRYPGFTPKMDGYKVDYRPSPALGGSNEHVYHDVLGVDDDKLAQLKKNGII